jgi:hypothetical protein
MKEKEQYIEDLKDIKDMMDRSSRFISLSGLSGISAGVIALIGAWWAYSMVFKTKSFGYNSLLVSSDVVTNLLVVATFTLIAALAAGIFFTSRKAKKKNQSLWDTQTKLMLANLAIPLVTGGVLSLVLLMRGFIGLMAPLTLIFYGLALVNASKYTFHEIRSLGIVEIILGLVSSYFIGYGIYFWALGFGVLHIVYGIIMQLKYGS